MMFSTFTLIASIGFALWSLYGFCKCLMKVNLDAKSFKELNFLPIVGCVFNLAGFCTLPILLESIF
jgi:hypothetical protein